MEVIEPSGSASKPRQLLAQTVLPWDKMSAEYPNHGVKSSTTGWSHVERRPSITEICCSGGSIADLAVCSIPMSTEVQPLHRPNSKESIGELTNNVRVAASLSHFNFGLTYIIITTMSRRTRWFQALHLWGTVSAWLKVCQSKA